MHCFAAKFSSSEVSWNGLFLQFRRRVSSVSVIPATVAHTSNKCRCAADSDAHIRAKRIPFYVKSKQYVIRHSGRFVIRSDLMEHKDGYI